jgi:ferritin-like metal-binding protein YciE
MTGTARALFENELKDTYDAEIRLVDSLKEMAGRVNDVELKRGFERHHDQTKRQVERLEKVFRTVGIDPEREECEGVKGLIKEFDTFVKEEQPTDDVLDVFASAAGLKTEHYEICSYTSLINLAYRAGWEETAATLKENLAEELATAKALESMSEKLTTQLPKS